MHLRSTVLPFVMGMTKGRACRCRFARQNNIGKILMLCRDCIREGVEPPIDYDLLRRSNIYILGELLTFENN